jgi:hypothetical protein
MGVSFIGPSQMRAPMALNLLKALGAGDARIVPRPVASLIGDHLVEAVARRNGDADWSGLGRLAARRAGVERVIPACVGKGPTIWLSFQVQGISKGSNSLKRWR